MLLNAQITCSVQALTWLPLILADLSGFLFLCFWCRGRMLDSKCSTCSLETALVLFDRMALVLMQRHCAELQASQKEAASARAEAASLRQGLEASTSTADRAVQVGPWHS